MNNNQHSEDFHKWWANEGSAMCPLDSEDAEEHVARVSEIAWSNGAYKAREIVLVLRNEVNCRIEHGAESNGHLEYAQSQLDSILETLNTL